MTKTQRNILKTVLLAIGILFAIYGAIEVAAVLFG